MLPALLSLFTLLGYGRLLVRCMRLRNVGSLTDYSMPASHHSFIHFGEDHCHLPSENSNLKATDSKRSLIWTIISKVLLFGLPEDHQARFESHCINQLIHTSRYRKDVSEIVEDLKKEVSRVSEIDIIVVSLLTIFS